MKVHVITDKCQAELEDKERRIVLALRAWIERIPDFTLTAPDEVTWADGQVRAGRSTCPSSSQPERPRAEIYSHSELLTTTTTCSASIG